MASTVRVPTADEIAKRLGMNSSNVSAFKSGKVITEERDASNDKDLCLLVALEVPASLEKTWEFVTAERVIELQDATLEQGNINLTTFELEGFKFDHGTKNNITKYAMSKAEAKTVSHAQDKEAAFKQILSARAKAYWEHGLKGIENYDGKNHDIAHDIQSANKATLQILRDPMLRNELEVIPSKSPHPEWHSLRWNIVQGNDTASVTLNHVFRIKMGENGFAGFTNKFYSGMDFDSSQIATGVLPTSEHQSAIFYINHTYTAAVAGFGGGAKRSIGRKMMKGKLVATMEKAQKVLAK